MSRSNSIVKQASILALAGILVRIIGLLYRSPLTAMILDEGNGYYSTAYNIYALVLLISSYSIPTAISKLISEKIALKEYKNVKRILKCVFIYVCAIAGSAAILLFILAPFIVDVNAVPALRVLCPTIFLSGLLGVFRGYFQAHKTTVYTSVSQIIEQIFNAVVALLAAYIFIQPYLGVDATKVGSYGAAGSAIGTGAGVLVGLIYMIFMYLKKKNTFVEEKDEEASERVDSYQEIFRMIMHIIAPIILATCVYNLVTTIDMYIFYFAQSFHHIDKITYISNYGVYAGKYIVLQNVPVALASAMSTASIPSISSAWALGNVKEAKEHITSGLSVTMLILIPAAVGMAVLSYPIMGVLFPQKATIMTATLLLALGSPAIIFYGLSTLTNGILQALGEVNVPLRNAAFSLVCHIIIIALLLFITPLGVYVLVFGNCTYALQVCYLNQKALRQKIGYKQEIKRTYVIPLLASLVMGAIVLGVYYGLFTLTHRVFLPLILSVVVGVFVYFVMIMYIYWEHPAYLFEIPYMKTLYYKIKRIMKENVDKVNSKNKELILSYLNNYNKDISFKVYNEMDYDDFKEIVPFKQYIKERSIWLVGGDGWAYDIGFGGIDHVLANNLDVNILVLDTEVYSNTGGQASKATRCGAVAKFASSGKTTMKKDLAKIAMTYPHVYVGTISLGANYMHTIKTLLEANSYKGPSIIIAYSPCISHGIKSGMKDSIKEEKLATESGYFPLYRYNPVTKKLSLDSKADFSKYDDIFERENRYRLKSDLLNRNKDNAISNYNKIKEDTE